MTNPRIEKVNADIAKTKVKIAEYTAKLRAFERHKTSLENEEIVALYRRENLNEDEFTALLRKQKKNGDTAEQDAFEDGIKCETEFAKKAEIEGRKPNEDN